MDKPLDNSDMEELSRKLATFSRFEEIAAHFLILSTQTEFEEPKRKSDKKKKRAKRDMPPEPEPEPEAEYNMLDTQLLLAYKNLEFLFIQQVLFLLPVAHHTRQILLKRRSRFIPTLTALPALHIRL